MKPRVALLSLLLTLDALALPARADISVQPMNETRIGDIQGSGDASPLVGQSVTTHGVVTLDAQTRHARAGFFLQDPIGDGDPESSDGVFVSVAPTLLDANVGDDIRVTGKVVELAGLTTLVAETLERIGGANVPPPIRVGLPQQHDRELERYEGMLVTFELLSVLDSQWLSRHGQLIVAGPDGQAQPSRVLAPTQLFAPGSPEARALEDESRRRMLILDDEGAPDDASPDRPGPGLGPELPRLGDAILGATGVLDEGPLGAGPSQGFRLQPTAAFERRADNPRPAAPSAEGLRVASLDLGHYFTTIGKRGAPDERTLAEQRGKLVRALLQLEAAVYGLTGLENNTGSHAALADLVGALNKAEQRAAFVAVDTGRLGTDDLRVGLIYRSDRVSPVGRWATLDEHVDPRAITTKNRPALAQTFRELSSSEELTVVINHWKSRTSPCDTVRAGTYEIVDPDTGDGQGACNRTRTSMADALTTWLERRPTGSRDTDVLILGTLNAYAREDPVRTLEAHGYVNLIDRQLGESAYNAVIDGRAGYVDHALASASLAAKLNRAAIWHSNADEPPVRREREATTPGHAPDPYAAAEHDPLLVTFTLRDAPLTPVPAIDDWSGWILLLGSTLLLIVASATASRRRRRLLIDAAPAD